MFYSRLVSIHNFVFMHPFCTMSHQCHIPLATKNAEKRHARFAAACSWAVSLPRTGWKFVETLFSTIPMPTCQHANMPTYLRSDTQYMEPYLVTWYMSIVLGVRCQAQYPVPGTYQVRKMDRRAGQSTHPWTLIQRVKWRHSRLSPSKKNKQKFDKSFSHSSTCRLILLSQRGEWTKRIRAQIYLSKTH